MAEKKTSTSKSKVKKKTTAKKATTPAKKKVAKSAVAKPKKTVSTTHTTAKASIKPAAKSTTKRKAKWGNGDRAALIQQQAYFIAEKRGFEGGDPVIDWRQAEKLVDEMFNL